MTDEEILIKKEASELVKKSKYCTNLDEIKEELGLDLQNYDKALEFAKNFALNGDVFPPIKKGDHFRLCRIGGKYAVIDEPIADLIVDLNNAGYQTLFCCSGHFHRNNPSGVEQYYIAFEFGDHIYKLLTKIFKEFSGISFDEYTKEGLEIKIGVKPEFKEYIKYIKYSKKRDHISKSNTKYWKQAIDIYYRVNKRDEAIELINKTIWNCVKTIKN